MKGSCGEAGRLLEKLQNSIVNFDFEETKRTSEDIIRAGISPYQAIMEMGKGMDIVGEKYERGEYFLSELIMAGETMKEGMKIIEPYLRVGETKKYGTVVIGTVKGDLHDIGKNIVITLLKAAGFQVIDLGYDVSAERFIEETRKSKPDILGMSALLSTTMPEMEATINKLQEAGVRDSLKVIVGGAPLTTEFGEKIGADAATNDAVRGVAICKGWMDEKRHSLQRPQDETNA